MSSTCHDDDRAAKWAHRLGPKAAAGFESEVLPHLPALRRLASRFVRAVADAEDLVQETMLRACRKWEQYEPGTNVRAWLMTIMRHSYINAYRTARRRPMDVDFDDGTQYPEDFPEAAGQSLAEGQTLTDETILRAIGALPVKYRDALLLSDVEGLPVASIARTLGVPVGTVKSRVHRARRQARSSLRGQAVELGIVGREPDASPCPAPCRRTA